VYYFDLARYDLCAVRGARNTLLTLDRQRDISRIAHKSRIPGIADGFVENADGFAQ
jgi:hypothetical protein